MKQFRGWPKNINQSDGAKVPYLVDMTWQLTQILDLAWEDDSLADGYPKGLRFAVQARQMIGSQSAAIVNISMVSYIIYGVYCTFLKL